MKKRKKILILTNSLDEPHTDTVINELEMRRLPYFRLNTDAITKGRCKTTMSFVNEKMVWQVEDRENHLQSSDVGCIWNRRPYEAWKFDIQDEAQKKFAIEELKCFFTGVWYSLDKSVKWVNDPYHEVKASKKIFQLQLARSLGMRTPDTIISNDPETVISFYGKHKGDIICKAIKAGAIDYGDKMKIIQTHKVSKEMLDNLSLIKNLITLFQERIEKKHEVRATVVGKRIFPVKIYSQEHPDSRIDFRNLDTIFKLRYEPCELPARISDFCYLMLDKLKLVYGAFDFAFTPGGEYVFFEVNTGGQWYWLQEATGLLITQALVDILQP